MMKYGKAETSLRLVGQNKQQTHINIVKLIFDKNL